VQPYNALELRSSKWSLCTSKSTPFAVLLSVSHAEWLCNLAQVTIFWTLRNTTIKRWVP